MVAKVGVPVAAIACIGVIFYRDLRDYLDHAQRYQVKHIEVKGTNRVSDEEIIRCSGIRPGSSIFSLDHDEVAARVAAGHHRIRSATASVTVPDRVTIEVVERVPVALVVFNRPYEIDADGVVLGEYEKGVSPGGPIISGIKETESLEEGARLKDDGLSDALALWRLFSSDVLSGELIVSEIDISESSSLIMIFSNKKYEIRWPRRNLEECLQLLRQTWGETSGFPRVRQYIDLRFGRTVATR
jgi:cell division septal protein FtsQ